MTDERNPVSELNPVSIRLEEKTETSFTDEDLADLNRFTDVEVDAFDGASDRTSPEYQELGSAGFVHTYAYDVVRNNRMNKIPLSIFLARNDKNQLVGYSIVSLDPTIDDPSKKVDGTFLGVGSGKQRQGIGTVLLKARNERLKELGIPSYEANVRPNVLKLYDKIGIRYEEKALPQISESPNIPLEGTHVRIFLGAP